MQNWRKDRNYRKYKNDDGSLKYVITINGEPIEVSPEVYIAYSQSDRRERYLAECDKGRLLSLDKMNDDNVTTQPFQTSRYTESAEDMAIREIFYRNTVSAIAALNQEDRELIRALLIENRTEREYAASAGLTQSGVNKRKKKILEILKKVVLKP